MAWRVNQHMCQDVFHWGLVVSMVATGSLSDGLCMSWAHAYDSGNFYIQQQTADNRRSQQRRITAAGDSSQALVVDASKQIDKPSRQQCRLRQQLVS